MTGKQSISIANENFKIQSEAITFVQKLRNRYTQDSIVTDRDDHEFLSELLKRHLEAPQKIGVGIQRFKVMEMNYGTRGFHVERTDGSSTDFSFHICVKRAHPAIKSRVASTFRVIVAEDLKAIRAKLFWEERRADGKIRCKKTRKLYDPAAMHLDHMTPYTFKSILGTFLRSKNLTFDAVRLAPHTDH